MTIVYDPNGLATAAAAGVSGGGGGGGAVAGGKGYDLFLSFFIKKTKKTLVGLV